MQTRICGILEFLDGKKQYIVPLFQRSYTWNKKQWDDLWADILGVMDTDRSHKHFMGAIVTVPDSTLPVGVNTALLIDGQQRLTTMSLLMCALRDVVLAKGDTLQADEIDDDLLTNRHVHTDTERYKLLPTQSDRGDYAAVVDRKPPQTGGQVAKAHEYFTRAIKAHLRDSPESIPQLRDCLKSRLYVVAVALGEDEDPHLIFESLNAKGSGLAASDLVRNFILMKFHRQFDGATRQQSIHDRYWQPLESRLSDNLIDFFFHVMIADKNRVPKKLIYSGMKAYLWPAGSENDAEVLELRLERLLDDSRRYRKLLVPGEDTDDDTVAAIKSLKAIDTTVLHPILLLLLRDFEHGKLSEGDLAKCFRLLESWMVRRTVCAGYQTQGFNKLTPDWCKKYPAIDHVNWIRGLIDAVAQARTAKMPSDAEVAESFLKDNFYTASPVNKFVLARLEESLTKEIVDSSAATIEHILPQNWAKAAGWAADASCGETGEDIDTLVHTIGNLTLTGYNSELGEKPFAAKRGLLRDSGYALNRMVAESETWNAEAIRARGRKLAELFCRVWPRTV